MNVVKRSWREIHPYIGLTTRRQSGEQQPRPAANLQHPTRSPCGNALYRGIHRLVHVLRGDGLSRVAAAPARDVECGVLIRGLCIRLLPQLLPLRDMLRAPLGAFLAVYRLQQRSFVRHHVSHQPPIPRLVFPNHRHCLTHRRMAQQRCLDLPQLDAVAAQLDLEVEAAKMLEVAVLAPAGSVTGAVERGPRRGAERIRDESLGGEFGPFPVTEAHALAPDAQLPRNADGAELAPLIEDIDRGVANRPANGDAVGGVGNAGASRPHSSLRGSVHVPQLDAACDQLLGKILGHCFATDQCLEGDPARPARLQEQSPGDRGGLQDGGTVLFKEGLERAAIECFIAGRDNDLGTDHER